MAELAVGGLAPLKVTSKCSSANPSWAAAVDAVLYVVVIGNSGKKPRIKQVNTHCST